VINISTDIQELGISEEDILHMLRAIGTRPLDTYTLTNVEAARELLEKAAAAELKRNRKVQRWESILQKFED